jgi:hypothetical protein
MIWKSMFRIPVALLPPLCAACGINASPPPPPQQAPPPVSQAPPVPDPRVVYDLREKCGREAREWFKHFYGDGHSRDVNGESHSNYTNHYNERLNRCYALLGTTGFIRDSSTHKLKESDNRVLVDVSENKDLGSYFKFSDMNRPMECNVGEKNCESLDEWNGLTALYVEH